MILLTSILEYLWKVGGGGESMKQGALLDRGVWCKLKLEREALIWGGVSIDRLFRVAPSLFIKARLSVKPLV